VAFRQGLRELGYVEGQNVTIEYRFAEGRLDRLADLAAELIAAQVEVIVAAPSSSAVAAKRATGTIPIVMIAVGDPEGLGLVASLGRPAGNVTGLSFGVGMQTFGKALELLAEAVPGVRRIAIISNSFNPTQSLVKRELDAAAHSVGVLLRRFDVGRAEDLEGAFAAMTDAQVGALMVITDALFINNAVRVADLATKSRLPSMHRIREGVEAGGLMSYGAAIADQWRRAAGYVDRILRGAKPAELPVEQPTKFELVINVKTAAALGLTIPPTLLARADEVIE
jgi:putative ABC transport system substrate-binding protein